jgi:hypothetical protein
MTDRIVVDCNIAPCKANVPKGSEFSLAVDRGRLLVCRGSDPAPARLSDKKELARHDACGAECLSRGVARWAAGKDIRTGNGGTAGGINV